ncbi:MAG: DUF6934 family protein [Bacteroidia bacterium]
MITIDLDNTILPHYVSHDLRDFRFYSPQKNGTVKELLVQIRDIFDPLLPNVFNIGFGPPNESGSFRDDVSMEHLNPGKVFSTVIVLAVAFLERNPSVFIGIDGSDDRRASLYHRMFRFNSRSLADMLTLTGVDWYVRLLRNGDVERDIDGNPYFKPRPEAFDFQRKASDLYRYYLINLIP